MQNDILFDNIYIGHSIEDAQKLKAETYDIKRPIEDAEEAASKPKDEPTDGSDVSFKQDPVKFIRSKVDQFIILAKEDPIDAVKTVPEVAGGLGALVITLLLVLFGAVGLGSSAPAPVKKDAGKDKAASEKAAEAVSTGAENVKAATKRTKSKE